MKLIQISTLSCYWCEVAKQYASLRLSENYSYLDISKEENKETAKKYMTNERGFPQFYLVDKEDKVIDKWVGWSQQSIDKVIKMIK